ncbi:MAG: ABC transporter ATP-binding protein [Armatimonadetes bacterium]|jgi:ABC-2 type transport system ATP-binding protein|nr:ABC transporter ATP-binding protein [Armatimonadota bacterium]
MSHPIETENLRKVYKLGKRKGDRIAVDSLNIAVPEGAVFGFLGPNGAGKTTTIKMLLDFVHPTSGSATIFGNPTSAASSRRLIGYLPEQPYFHKFLRPIEVVSMHASLAGVPRKEVRQHSISALERSGIAEYSDTPIGKLSKGLTQRVGIAQAIVGDPKLLIMDEPTSGLDPIGRRHARDLILQLRDEGRTIFLSSHLLSEVESTCDIIAVLKRGKLVAMGKPDDVQAKGKQVTIQVDTLTDETKASLKFAKVGIEEEAGAIRLCVAPEMLYWVIRMLEKSGAKILRLQTERESLEEAFLRLAA